MLFTEDTHKKPIRIQRDQKSKDGKICSRQMKKKKRKEKWKGHIEFRRILKRVNSPGR